MGKRNNENNGHFKIHLFVHPPKNEEKDRDPKRMHRGRKGNPLWKHGGPRHKQIEEERRFYLTENFDFDKV